MADIEIGYKGSTITSINSGGVTTLNTIGTFCEDNITVTFNKTQGEVFTPATTITTNPSITLSATTGTITAFYSGASNITPTVTPGYVSAGTAGIVRTSGTSTYQLSTVAAQTITPTTASQLAVASGRFTTGSVYVGAIPIPAFDVTWDDDWTDIVAVTCNMTYAECAALVNNPGEDDHRAIAYEHDQSQTYGFYTGGNNDTYRTRYIKYIFGQANYDLLVNSDGTITWNCPSSDLVTAGTPTATKGSVSNHSVLITPSVTNPYGYIYGGTITGSPVTVSASELVSGTLSITSNGTYDVTEYASVSTNIPEAERFAPIYKTLAYRSMLYASGSSRASYGSYTASDVTDWCNSLTSIVSGQFTNQQLSGDFNFENVSKINYIAFGSAYGGVFYGGGGYYTLNFPICTSVGAGAFTYQRNVTSIYLPMVSIIERETFANCSSLTYINVESCVSIGNSVFDGCSKLASINLPLCQTLGNYAFNYCTSLSTIFLPVCQTIGSNAFVGCSVLTSINLPLCTSISSNAFQYCHSLSMAYLPLCTYIGASAFMKCEQLVSINLPLCSQINQGTFSNCSNLSTIILQSCTSIATYAFASCYNLLSLYLLGSSIITLANYYAFNSTPISTYTTSTGGVYGSIFVRASLYNSYKTSTNWSYYSSRFVSLTDAEIEALGF